MKIVLIITALFCHFAFAGPAAPQAFGKSTPNGAITLSFIATCASNVAPRECFFDATGSTSTTAGASPYFHNMQYSWTVTPCSGTWSYGSRAGVASRCSGTGPNWAHVFDPAPGSGIQAYMVTLVVYDGTDIATQSQAFTTTDPNTVFAGTLTTCVAASTLPIAGSDGCPTGAAVAQQANFATIISTYALSGKRVSLKHDDTFTSAASGVLAVAGPGLIGMYGSGAKPLISATADSIDMIQLSSSTTPTISDWRIQDLQFNGNANTNSTAVNTNGGINKVLLLRLDAQSVHNGAEFNSAILDYWNANSHPGHTLFDTIAVQDCTTSSISGSSAALSLYASATHFALLGNSFNNNGGGEHTVRLPSIVRGVVSDNTLQGQASSKHALTLRSAVHGASGVEGGADTQYNVISDNKFIGATGSDWTVTLEPQAADDERVVDTILERNWFVSAGGASGTQIGLYLFAYARTTVRDNVFDMTGGKAHQAITAGLFGVASQDSIWVYHNTAYSGDTDNDFGIFNLANTSLTNVKAYNNLGYAPNDSQHQGIGCNGSSTLTSCTGMTVSTNSSTAQVGATNPLFTSTSPFNPTNAKPTAGSYAVGGGTAVPVWSDFFLVTEPGTRDIGAVIH